MSVTSLCNCGGPDPSAGQHEPFCAENGLRESLGNEHKHFTFSCVYCPYGSPFFHPTLEEARRAYASHLVHCAQYDGPVPGA